MTPKSMSSEVENIEIKSKEKKHGQIEFVRIAYPDTHNHPIISALQAAGQFVRTNSICPCYFFSMKS